MTAPRKTRIQQRNEAKIIAAAQTVFAETGFKGATMERIAELSGMSQPNLHNYFNTKLDLYLEVLRKTLDLWLTPLEHLAPDGDPEEQLRGYIERKLEMIRHNPEASRVFAHEMLNGAPLILERLHKTVRPRALAFAGTIDRWIKESKLHPVDSRHLLFMIWAMTQHYADFAPQVEVILGRKPLTRKDYGLASHTICQTILGGLLRQKKFDATPALPRKKARSKPEEAQISSSIFQRPTGLGPDPKHNEQQRHPRASGTTKID